MAAGARPPRTTIRVAEIDGETYEGKRYILVGDRLWQRAFTPDEKYVIATNGIANNVTLIGVQSVGAGESATRRRDALAVMVQRAYRGFGTARRVRRQSR